MSAFLVAGISVRAGTRRRLVEFRVWYVDTIVSVHVHDMRVGCGSRQDARKNVRSRVASVAGDALVSHNR